jgi:polysaccharide biosynthesis transport protein
VLAPLITYVAASQFTPRYTATGSLIYDAAEYKLRELQSILRVDPITDAVMATQAEVLRGMPVVEQVANWLNLHTNPEFNTSLLRPSLPRRALAAAQRMVRHFILGLAVTPEAADDVPGPKMDPVRNATLHAIQAALIVTPLKSSRVLEVSFTAENPVIAAAAVNDAMDIYVKSQLSAKYGAVMRAREWLERRAKELRTEVQHSEDAIAKYRASNGLVEGMHAGLDTERSSLFTEDLVRARSALAAAEGRLDAVSGRAGAAAQAAIAPSVAPLRARQGQLTAQLQSMMGRLGTSHPDVQSLRTQLVEADRTLAAEGIRVVTAIEADVRADRQRVATLEQILRDVRARIEQESQAQIPLNAMQRDAEASRALLQAVLERMQQTAQQSGVEAPDAHEISLALPPDKPSFPRINQWLMASAVFGIALGLLLVYLFELADQTFHTGDDIRTVLGLPCLALIPRIAEHKPNHAGVEDCTAGKRYSPFAEQMRALRASLSIQQDRPRVIAITAARPKEGKTTVTHALARLAATNGERVIVIDCDLHESPFEPSMHNDPNPGLRDYLQEQVLLGEVVRKDRATGIDYIPGGTSGANALGLPTSGGMARLLQTLRQDYDLVLLDTPPTQAVTDARILAGLADATVLCVRWRSTPRDAALHALKLLEEAHANVVGAALTQVDANVHVRSGYADAEVYHPRYGGYFRE